MSTHKGRLFALFVALFVVLAGAGPLMAAAEGSGSASGSGSEAGSGSAVAAGGAKSPTDVLIEVGTKSITREEYDATVAELPPRVRSQVETPQGRVQWLKQMGDLQLLSSEAEKRGVMAKPEAQNRLRELTVQVLSQGYVTEQMKKNGPDEAAVKAYYDKHPDEFKGDDKFHLFQITMADATAAAALKKEIDGGKSFIDAAKASSVDTFKSSGGDAGFKTRDEMPVALQSVLDTLKDGAVSEVLRVNDQAMLAMIKEREKGQTQPFAEVSDQISKHLQGQKQKEVLDKLTADLGKEFGLKMNEDKFSLLAKPELTDADNAVELFTVGTESVKVASVAEELGQIPPFLRPQVLQGEGLQKFVQQFVLRKLLAAYTEKHFDEMAKARPMAVKMANQQVAVMSLLDEEVANRVKLDDAALQAYYLGNPDKFKQAAKFRASHILVADEASATALLKQIEGGASFTELAKQHSTCPSKEKGGDLGFFEKGQMVPEFEKAVADNDVGKLVGPVKTQFGFHLIRVEEKQKEGTTPFEQVKEGLKKQLTGEKQKEAVEQFMEELRKATPVKEHPERL